MYTLFDLVALIVIGLLGFIGLRRGLIEEALKLVGMILASVLAVRFYGLGIALIADIFSVSEGVQTVIGFIIIFLIVYLSVQLLSSILKRIVSSLNLVWLDRLSGLAFGATKGILIMSIIVWCFSIFSGTQLVNKLETGSPAYIMLSRCKTSLISMSNLEQRSETLQESVRDIFKMDTPLPFDIPAAPDSLSRKLEYLDKFRSTQDNP